MRYFLCYIRFLAPSAATDCSHSVSRGTCIPRLSLVYYVQKLDAFNRIDISHRKDGERYGSILRHFDPISRHVARRGVRVLHEKVAQRRCAALADGLCRGRDGRGLGLEPADPRHRAVVGDGETLVSAGVSRLLVNVLKKYVPESEIELPWEVNILDSISNLEYAVGSYTTVLVQAYLSGKKILLNDVTFKRRFGQLKDYGYILTKDDLERLSQKQ